MHSSSKSGDEFSVYVRNLDPNTPPTELEGLLYELFLQVQFPTEMIHRGSELQIPLLHVCVVHVCSRVRVLQCVKVHYLRYVVSACFLT